MVENRTRFTVSKYVLGMGEFQLARPYICMCIFFLMTSEIEFALKDIIAPRFSITRGLWAILLTRKHSFVQSYDYTTILIQEKE